MSWSNFVEQSGWSAGWSMGWGVGICCHFVEITGNLGDWASWPIWGQIWKSPNHLWTDIGWFHFLVFVKRLNKSSRSNWFFNWFRKWLDKKSRGIWFFNWCFDWLCNNNRVNWSTINGFFNQLHWFGLASLNAMSWSNFVEQSGWSTGWGVGICCHFVEMRNLGDWASWPLEWSTFN